MRQKLCKRLEDLEKISAAAAAAQRARTASVDTEAVLEQIRIAAEAWHSDPKNQEWLAAQPPEYFRNSLQQLKAELEERAAGYSGSYGARGF